MKKITSSLLLVLAFAACSEQRPENMREMLKASYQKRATVKAVKTEIKKLDGFSEVSAKPEIQKIKAEMEPNGKDFKFFSDSEEMQVAFNGEKLVIVSHKDKWFIEMSDPQEYTRQLKRYSEVVKNFLPFSSAEDYFKTVDTSTAYDEYVWNNDTTVNKEEVYHISRKSHDEGIGLDFYTKQMISKKTGFPYEILTLVKNGDHLVQLDNMYLNKIETLEDIDDKEFNLEIPEAYMPYDTFIAEFERKKQEESGVADEITPVELNEGDVVPNWTLMDADGNEVSLESLRGKPVILDFWGTWCVWCVVAMPKIETVYQEIGDKAHIYGISCKEPDDADPKAFLKEKGVTYPTLVKGDNVAKLLNVEGYPTLLVIDKEGKLLHKHSGYSKDLDKSLIELLKAKS